MTVLRQLTARLRFDFDKKSRKDHDEFNKRTDQTRDKIDRYGKSQEKARRGQERFQRTSQRTRQSTGRLGVAFGGLNKQLAGLAATFGLGVLGKGLSDTGQSLDNLENRLRSIEGAEAPIAKIRQELAEISFMNFSNLEDTAQIFQRFRFGTEDLGKTRQQVLDFTDQVQKAAIISGANPTEVNNALIQFSQGISSNRLGGEEFRAVSEQLVTILRVLKRETGITTGELREEAFDGKLTAKRIFDAFENNRDFIQDGFDQLEVNRDLALQRFKVGYTTFFGSLVQESGINKDLADFFQSTGRFMLDNERFARRLGLVYRDFFQVIGDGFGAMAQSFAGGGVLSSVGAGFAAIGENVGKMVGFLRVYSLLRNSGDKRGEAFDKALGVFFSPETVATMKKIGEALKPVGKALAFIFGARMLLGVTAMISSFAVGLGPITAAVVILSAAFVALNRENSGLKKLWEKLKQVWNGGLGDVFKELAVKLVPLLEVGFKGLVILVEGLANTLLFLVNRLEDAYNIGRRLLGIRTEAEKAEGARLSADRAEKRGGRGASQAAIRAAASKTPEEMRAESARRSADRAEKLAKRGRGNAARRNLSTLRGEDRLALNERNASVRRRRGNPVNSIASLANQNMQATAGQSILHNSISDNRTLNVTVKSAEEAAVVVRQGNMELTGASVLGSGAN